MAGDPVLHLLAGPNGSGKSTLYERVIEPVTGLEFVNADRIAKAIWPEAPEAHSYDAAVIAGQLRDDRLSAGRSFCYETVFSHESKLDVVHHAMAIGFIVELHVVIVPVELTVARVKLRQGEVKPPPATKPAAPPSLRPIPLELGDSLRDIGDPELRAVLESLARSLGENEGTETK